MEKITCDVIQDILPLYCDDVCSKDSRELVEKHLEDCAGCSELLGKLKQECSFSNEKEYVQEEIVKDMADAWKKSIRKSFCYGVLIMLCICGVLTGGYVALTRLVMVTIPADKIEIMVEEVTEQYVSLALQLDDGKKVLRISSEATADGKCYVTMKRGVIAVENGGGQYWKSVLVVSRNKWISSEESVPITEIYYGTEQDGILIWKADTAILEP